MSITYLVLKQEFLKTFRVQLFLSVGLDIFVSFVYNFVQLVSFILVRQIISMPSIIPLFVYLHLPFYQYVLGFFFFIVVLYLLLLNVMSYWFTFAVAVHICTYLFVIRAFF